MSSTALVLTDNLSEEFHAPDAEYAATEPAIKALKLGDERYYLALALEDYYLQGGEPPGMWLGSSGAKILGLTGNVTNE